jgi:hypothetical protein
MKHVKLFEQFITESGIFNTWTELIGSDLRTFMSSYEKLHKDNQIIKDKKNEFIYGVRKGQKEAHWKYDEAEGQLHHSEKERDVLGLINFYNMVNKNHPWSK